MELNLNGLYTECDDQSAWYYLRSLVYLIVDYTKRKVSDTSLSDNEVAEPPTLLTPDVAQSLISKELDAINELEEAAPDCIYLSAFRTEIERLLHSILCSVS